jgi:hypothetical protein
MLPSLRMKMSSQCWIRLELRAMVAAKARADPMATTIAQLT